MAQKNTEKTRPKLYLTRIESFSAAHRLDSSKLTEEENKSVFGKCNNLHGHGHNYKVEVTIAGYLDEASGMVMNITALKGMIWDVLKELDHKHLNLDVEYFKDVNSTSENITFYIWKKLTAMLPKDVELHEVKLHETEKNIAVFRGEMG